MNALERAKLDIDDGRFWKARDRLTGALAMRPADQELLALLGETYFLMGDHPEAARYWILTERTGPDVDKALAAFEELHHRGGPRAKLLALKLRAPVDEFPETVQRRLAELSKEAKSDQDFNWSPKPRDADRIGDDSWRENLFFFFLIAATVGIWVIGVVAIAIAIVRLI